MKKNFSRIISIILSFCLLFSCGTAVAYAADETQAVAEKSFGDKIAKGEVIATLHTNREKAISTVEKRYLAALTVEAQPKEAAPVIYGTVRMGKDGEPVLMV